MSSTIVGILGGTGIDRDPNLLTESSYISLDETPYGLASDSQAITGYIEGIQVYIISRHGRDHDINPSNVNYRANLWALTKQLGCTHILATSACGSLKEELAPGHIGILDQYIDNTRNYRNRSFYKVCHVEQRNPIDKKMQGMIEAACIKLGIPHHKDLTVVTVEGPRFSTLAESKLFRSWGCDVVNMTSVPEVPLIAELGVIYGCMMLITDYDCWREGEESVNATLVVERMKDLGGKARKIIAEVIKSIKEHDWSSQIETNREKVKLSIMAE